MSDEPTYALSPEQLYHAADLAARIYGSMLLHVDQTLNAEQSAAMAVEVAMAIINEVREYRLKDNKAVRREDG